MKPEHVFCRYKNGDAFSGQSNCAANETCDALVLLSGTVCHAPTMHKHNKSETGWMGGWLAGKKPDIKLLVHVYTTCTTSSSGVESEKY